MLLRQSKYAEVRADSDPAEINALHAYVRGQGIGTAIIRAAEAIGGVARSRDRHGCRCSTTPAPAGCTSASATSCGRARRCWTTWTEKDADGNIVRTHAAPATTC